MCPYLHTCHLYRVCKYAVYFMNTSIMQNPYQDADAYFLRSHAGHRCSPMYLYSLERNIQGSLD